MREERITSRQNPLVQQVRKLMTSRRFREEQKLFAGDGIKLLAEAVTWCPGLETVLLSDGVEAATPEGVRRVRVPEALMESISPMQTPQGAIFLCRMPEAAPFLPEPGMLLLDGIQDPGNLGTILRTADALDIPVALLEGCADLYSPKTVRASMGAVFRRSVCCASWGEAERVCREEGIAVSAAALSPDAKDLRQVHLGTMAVVLGAEGQGIRPEILNSAGISKLIIPMNPHCESLNVAVAATIVMWQMKTEQTHG